MAQLLIRNVEDSVRDRLRARALRHRRSMEEELREILREAAATEIEAAAVVPLGTWIASRFAGKDLDFDIEELRGEPVRPVEFEE
jgi:plasmid stability protein